MVLYYIISYKSTKISRQISTKKNSIAILVMAGALGVEPSSVVLETIILPMYYAPINNTLIILTYIYIICKLKYKF